MSRTASKLLTMSAVYFAMVFAAGFLFGTVRVMWVVPAVGVRAAELSELPLMLIAVVFAARWVHRRFPAPPDHRSRLIVGVTALVLLLFAELILGIVLLGLTPKAVFLARDPVSGTAYYASLGVFALMPWLLGRVGSGRGLDLASGTTVGQNRTS